MIHDFYVVLFGIRTNLEKNGGIIETQTVELLLYVQIALVVTAGHLSFALWPITGKTYQSH